MTIHETMYERLLSLYPGAFREELGAEMIEVFSASIENRDRSAAAVWIGELTSLPFSLVEAWASEPASGRAGRVAGFLGSPSFRRWSPAILVSFVLMFAIGASHLIADLGLFHYPTIALVALIIGASGLGIGIVSRIPAERGFVLVTATLLVASLMAGGVLALDRLLLTTVSPGSTRTVSLPGLDLAFSVSGKQARTSAPAESGYRDYRRLRVVTSGGENLRTLTVRSAASDWVWTSAVLLLLLAGAGTGWRLNPISY